MEPSILPSPLYTLSQYDRFLAGSFFLHLKSSFLRISTGAFLAFFLGTFLAVLAVLCNAKKFAESLHAMGQTLPAVIVAVLLLIMMGTGDMVPILLIVLMVTPFVAVQTMAVITKPDPLMEMVVRSHGGGKRQLVLDIYLPKLVPTMRGTAILATTMGVKVCILGEFIGSENGLGFLINVARLYLNMDEVLFYVVVILIQMFIFQLAVELFFRFFFKRYFYPA